MTNGNFRDRGGLTVDELLETLQNRVRRELIYYFETTDERTATLEELFDHLDAAVPARDRSSLAVALVHEHLPRLQSSGWLDVDRRSETVRYRGCPAAASLLTDIAAVFDE